MVSVAMLIVLGAGMQMDSAGVIRYEGLRFESEKIPSGCACPLPVWRSGFDTTGANRLADVPFKQTSPNGIYGARAARGGLV